MTDSRVYRMRHTIDEHTYDRSIDDPPNRGLYLWLRHQLRIIERDLRRQDVLMLETLIERKTGVK